MKKLLNILMHASQYRKHIKTELHTQVRAITRSTEYIPGGKCLKLVKSFTKTAPGPSLNASISSFFALRSKFDGSLELALSAIKSTDNFSPFSSFGEFVGDPLWPCCCLSFSRGAPSENCCIGFASRGTSLAKYRVTNVQNIRKICATYKKNSRVMKFI